MSDFDKILAKARDAASAAIQAKYDAGEREQPFNCGFAWVTIKGTSPLARHLAKRVEARGGEHRLTREERMLWGSKGYPKGWQFWKPGIWPTPPADTRSYQQDMDFHAAAARAFAGVLKEHGIEAEVGTRLD
jgi:hypothetical protein